MPKKQSQEHEYAGLHLPLLPRLLHTRLPHTGRHYGVWLIPGSELGQKLRGEGTSFELFVMDLRCNTALWVSGLVAKSAIFSLQDEKIRLG